MHAMIVICSVPLFSLTPFPTFSRFIVGSPLYFWHSFMVLAICTTYTPAVMPHFFSSFFLYATKICSVLSALLSSNRTAIHPFELERQFTARYMRPCLARSAKMMFFSGDLEWALNASMQIVKNIRCKFTRPAMARTH